MIVLTLCSALMISTVEDQRPIAENWQLVWSDEFDGNAINTSNWTFDVDCWGGGNDERQCYTDRAENARVADGMLIIEAHREAWSGAPFPERWGRTGEPVSREFTSARLTTRGLAAWRYGRFEVRAQLPFHQGSWPAIWMLPEDSVYGGWAASGEIDIMEAINLGEPCADCATGVEDRVWGTIHYGGPAPDNTYSGNSVTLDDPAAFHTYGLEWTPDEIVWLLDGAPYARQTAEDWHTTGSDGASAPFDQAFHIILNLAIGGTWPESSNLGGVSEQDFPRQMRIDFVRVHACPSDPETLQSCRDGGSDDD